MNLSYLRVIYSYVTIKNEQKVNGDIMMTS